MRRYWLGPERNIRNIRSSEVVQIALQNAVNVAAGKSLEILLYSRQMKAVDRRVPLDQTNLVGAACGFEPVNRDLSKESMSVLAHCEWIKPLYAQKRHTIF